MANLLLNRYEIVKSLSSGGFGETFLAKDTQMPSQRLVVVKKLKPANASQNISTALITQLFEKEAAVLEELGNGCSQIPKLYSYFCEDNEFYLVQEYIAGQSLSQVGMIGTEQAKTILSSLLTTLKYIHGKGIIHRDIKPENIILRDGDKLPVLIDFGAVKETMGTVTLGSGSTASSVVIGTPGFMAPEQAIGRSIFSTDLYALGLTIIFTLTQKSPIEFSTSHLTGELDWESDCPQIAPFLARILNKAIKIELSSRYPTAEAMYKDLYSLQVKSHGLSSTNKKTAETIKVISNYDSNNIRSTSQNATTQIIKSSEIRSKYYARIEKSWGLRGILIGIIVLLAMIVSMSSIWAIKKAEEAAENKAKLQIAEAELKRKDADNNQRETNLKINEIEQQINQERIEKEAQLEQERLAKKKVEAELSQLRMREETEAALKAQQSNQLKSSDQPMAVSTPNKKGIENATVFIQYKSDELLAQELQNSLILQGVNIERAIEKIDNIKRDDVRYSNPSARPLALAVKENVESFYRNKGMNKNLEMIDLSTRGFTTPDNQIEIWIND